MLNPILSIVLYCPDLLLSVDLIQVPATIRNIVGITKYLMASKPIVQAMGAGHGREEF